MHRRLIGGIEEGQQLERHLYLPQLGDPCHRAYGVAGYHIRLALVLSCGGSPVRVRICPLFFGSHSIKLLRSNRKRASYWKENTEDNRLVWNLKYNIFMFKSIVSAVTRTWTELLVGHFLSFSHKFRDRSFHRQGISCSDPRPNHRILHCR